MTRVEFIIATAAAAQKRNPHLTQKQAAHIAERIAQVEDANIGPLWTWNTNPALRNEFVGLALNQIEAAAPELFRLPPSRGQYIALQAADIEAKLGRPATATEKMNLARAAADLSPDDLLERIPPGTQLPDLAPPPKLSQNTAPQKDDIATLDAEVEQRWGKKPHELMASDRRRYHDLIKNEQHRAASAERNREAALASVDGFDKLPPAQRMALHRAAEKAKQQNRA